MILCVDFGVWASSEPPEGPRRPGSSLKSPLVSVGFILTEFGTERSHGDPFRAPGDRLVRLPALD